MYTLYEVISCTQPQMNFYFVGICKERIKFKLHMKKNRSVFGNVLYQTKKIEGTNSSLALVYILHYPRLSGKLKAELNKN